MVELHGATQTHRIERPFGGKNIDVLCDLFAQSLETGVRNESLPSFRDAAIASEYAWRFFLQDARTHDMPAIGDLGELAAIRDRRRTMKRRLRTAPQTCLKGEGGEAPGIPARLTQNEYKPLTITIMNNLLFLGNLGAGEASSSSL